MRSAVQVGLIGLCFLCPAEAMADSVSFQPTPADLWDLDHHDYITWGIGWSVPAGEQITSVTLFIDNINDWKVEQGDILYIHLLDNPQIGVRRWADNQGGGDAFAGQGVLLTTYTDDDGPPNPPEDFSYDFTPDQIAALTDYAANGAFGLGFDPDCHYFNDGVTLTIATAVPEPTAVVSMILAGSLLRCARRRLSSGC